MSDRNIPNDEQDLRTRWIAALRSGKYKQGVGCLRDSTDRMCCLGVLCDLVDPNGWIDDGEEWQWRQPGASYGSAKYPPDEITALAFEGSRGELATRNDQGVSFADIADYVEAQTALEKTHG